MSLDRYARIRDFSRTPEPPPARAERSGSLTFTIQKHNARRLHYDFRLEIDGVLVSWPIPRGPSYDSRERRLAVQTEDHPYEYGTFEGVIPSPEYGGGQVIVWDAGSYTLLDTDHHPIDFHDRVRNAALARDALERGHLSVFLNGRKLKGGWTLLRTRGNGLKSQWLFIKRRDGLEDPRRDVIAEDQSVFSGLTIVDLKGGKLPASQATTLLPTPEGLPAARRTSFPKPYEPKLGGDWGSRSGPPGSRSGSRVLAFVADGNVQLRSLGGQAFADCYPEVARWLKKEPLEHAVLDGEIAANGPRYLVCDLLYLDGFDLRGVALSERKHLLHAVLAPLGGVQESAV